MQAHHLSHLFLALRSLAPALTLFHPQVDAVSGRSCLHSSRPPHLLATSSSEPCQIPFLSHRTAFSLFTFYTLGAPRSRDGFCFLLRGEDKLSHLITKHFQIFLCRFKNHLLYNNAIQCKVVENVTDSFLTWSFAGSLWISSRIECAQDRNLRPFLDASS